jgi:hypothetical protein
MKFSPSQIAEPLQLRPIANRPWQNIGADLFDLGKKKFLIVTDYLSLYPEVISLTSSNSNAIITAMKSILARHGMPDILYTDNGPSFNSIMFKEFCKVWSFQHITSSSYFPKSNGLIESSVKAKKMCRIERRYF